MTFSSHASVFTLYDRRKRKFIISVNVNGKIIEVYSGKSLSPKEADSIILNFTRLFDSEMIKLAERFKCPLSEPVIAKLYKSTVFKW